MKTLNFNKPSGVRVFPIACVILGMCGVVPQVVSQEKNVDAELKKPGRPYIQLTDQVKPDVDAPEFLSINLVPAENAAMEIKWSLSELSTGQIFYGSTIELGSATKAETSFRFDSHRQYLPDLVSGKTYFYKIVATDAAGNSSETVIEKFLYSGLEADNGVSVVPGQLEVEISEVEISEVEISEVEIPEVEISEVEVLQVEAESLEDVQVASSNGLDYSNDHLQLSGLFYGNMKGGISPANGPIAFQNAIRFRAERTGIVNAVRFNNRVLTQANISDRCDSQGNSSVWCVCVNNNLTAGQCGHTLSNSYSVGSGGLITVEFRTDDGTANHLPGSTILATSAPYIPINITDRFPTISLLQPTYVEAGKLYHIVLRNDKPPTSCGLSKLSPNDARNCPNNEGAIGLNGTLHATDPNSNLKFGPYLGKIGSAMLYKKKNSSNWKNYEHSIPFYELRYDDGVYIGDSYSGYDNQKLGLGTHTIEGQVVARQRFIVEQATRHVNGLWLQIGHPDSKAANGESLTVKLRDSSGDVLATGLIGASMECSKIATAASGESGISALYDRLCRTWKYTDLSTSVRLFEGAEYVIDFSAPAGAAFNLSTFFSAHRQDERNMWNNAEAHISKDGGSKWANWTNSWETRDLPVLFTVIGGPKAMP